MVNGKPGKIEFCKPDPICLTIPCPGIIQGLAAKLIHLPDEPAGVLEIGTQTVEQKSTESTG